jgi:SAM-dependent methyltransferase
MHGSSLVAMGEALGWLNYEHPARELDVGARDINGSYRHLFDQDDYLGYDLQPGPNVAVVGDVSNPYELPFQAQAFDLIVCGQVLEHCPWPWALLADMKRIKKPGGSIILVAPSAGPLHMQPDCWRVNLDGMWALAQWVGLSVKYGRTLEAKPWNDTVVVLQDKERN